MHVCEKDEGFSPVQAWNFGQLDSIAIDVFCDFISAVFANDTPDYDW